MIVAWKPDSVVFVQLRKHIKHLIKCFFSYPNISNFVKSTPLHYVFRNPAEVLTCLFLPFLLLLDAAILKQLYGKGKQCISLDCVRCLPAPKYSHSSPKCEIIWNSHNI